MASNFIPMLSSSPPPLDDCQDNEDDDEEFGTFTAANIAFDSSFDSPVAGEKYKSFIKPGNNGVNDLNAFPSPKQSITLNFSKPNQNIHSDSQSTDQNEVSNKSISNSISKESNYSNSSTEELNTKNTETSQNCVPEVVGDCESSLFKENDRSKRKQFSFHSNVEEESISVHSNIDSCDSEVLDPSIVPPSDEFEMTKAPEDSYIPGEGDAFQSAEVVANCDESLNCSADCTVEELNILKSNALPNDISQSESKSETLEAEFQADFDGVNSFEADFDDFQGVSSTASEKTSVLFNGSVDEKESFEAHFDDFHPLENDQDTEFADFKANEDFPSDATYKTCEKEDITDFRGEFADFKASEDHSDFDEFDDFQSFDKPNSSLPKVETSQVPVNPSDNNQSSNNFEQTSDQDEFDDFDDFQACSEVGAPVESGFASFAAAPSNDKSDSGSPEFADFERASFSSASGETYPNSPCLSSSSYNQDKNAEKLSTVMNAIFPPQEDPSDGEVSYDPELEIVGQSIKSRRLWEKLNEAEQTPGLKFQWGVSNSFQQLLRSVNVDYHSILRTSSVPIFASGLSLLEPVKGQTSSASAESEDKVVPSPRDPIPPVEFDWNSSGLVNPLDTGQSSSILMDLSFLSSSNTASSSTIVEDHSFENELLKPSPAPAFPESNKTFILEELLSKNICSIPNSNVTHRPSNLSEEANSVLDRLPDLSYMRAKVLMFPISNKT